MNKLNFIVCSLTSFIVLTSCLSADPVTVVERGFQENSSVQIVIVGTDGKREMLLVTKRNPHQTTNIDSENLKEAFFNDNRKADGHPRKCNSDQARNLNRLIILNYERNNDEINCNIQ